MTPPPRRPPPAGRRGAGGPVARRGQTGDQFMLRLHHSATALPDVTPRPGLRPAAHARRGELYVHGGE